MDKFLDAFDQLKLNQEDINFLHRSITSNEIEVSQQKKTQGPMDSLLNSIRTLKKS
jgi:hypothetical protein